MASFLEQLIGSINQGAGRAMDYVTPGDQRRMYMSKQQVQQQDTQKKKKAYEQVRRTPLAQKQQPRINSMLDRGASFEDISTQTGLGVNEVRGLADYMRPGYGIKPKTALEQIGDVTASVGKGVVDAATVLPRKVGTTLGFATDTTRDAGNALRDSYQRGEISADKLIEEADKLGMKDVIGQKLVLDAQGNFSTKAQNPLEFTRDFTNAGIDTAGTVVPFAKGASVATNGQRLLSGGKLTEPGRQLMKEGNAWMGLTTAQSAMNGQLTPEAIAMNAAASYGLPFAGAATARTVKATAKEVTKAARKQEESIFRQAAQGKILQRVEPHYIQPSGKQLDQGIVSQHRAAIINGNIDPIIVTQNADGTMKILDGEHRYQAYKELGVAQIPTRVVTPAEVRMMKSGGYVGGPQAKGFADAEKNGRVFEGVDGKPRFEATDREARLVSIGDAKDKLENLLAHPTLYDNYPQLKNLPVDIKIDKNFKGAEGGVFDPKTGIEVYAKNHSEAKETLLHEMQHAIQEAEGFAKGGDIPNMKWNPEADKAFDTFKDTPAGKQALQKLVKEAMAKDPTLTETQATNLSGHKFRSNWMYSQYHNLAGEAEARAVAARRNMTDEERYVAPDLSQFQKRYHQTTKEAAESIKKDGFNMDKRASGANDILPIGVNTKKTTKDLGLGDADSQLEVYFNKDANIKEFASRNQAEQFFANHPDGGKFREAVLRSKQIDVEYQRLVDDAGKRLDARYTEIWNKGVKAADDAEYQKIRAEEEKIIEDWGKAVNEQAQIAQKESTRLAKQEGWDGIHMDQDVGSFGRTTDNTIILDPSKVNTESRLPKRSTFYDSLDVPKKDLIVRNEGGVAMSIDGDYIKNQAASYNTPDEFINDLVDRIWANNKTGKGVDQFLTPDEYGSGFSGRKTISNNSAFYRDYYAEYGTKPSKKAVREMVEQAVAGKKDSVYKNLLTPEDVSNLDASIYDELVDRQTSLSRQNSNPIPIPEGASVPVVPKAQLPTPTSKKPVEKLSKRVKQAENDFIAGKIDGNRLEAIREADAKGVPLPKKVLPARNLDTNQYIKDQTKAQKAAGKTGMGLKDKTADFKEKFIDDLAPIEDRLNKAIKNGTSVDPKDHITYQLDRSRRAEGIMNAYVRDNGLDKIIQNVKNTNEFDQYLIARHAKELDESITTGRDAAKDAALVKQLDEKYAPAAKELYKYNQNLLDKSVEYGLISKATATSLKKQYPEYVPFNRIFNEDELTAISGGNGSGNASIGKQTVVQKLKGSKRAIASPLNSIIDKTRLVVEQGERNKAAQMLASYKDIEGNPFNLKELSPSETIGSRHTVSYLDNGKKRVFETDKEIADAAKNMTREEIGMWGRIAAIPARLLRGGATTMNVGFAGANVVKDVMGAAINSRHAFRIADPEALGKALSAALHHNGKYYHELMREGVSGTSFDMYRNPLKSNVGELRSHKNIGTRAAYNVTHPGQWMRTFENAIGRSEDFGRALQYYSNKKGYKADGKNAKDATILAADQARSNSTNFFRHGSVGKNINTAIPYWNAGVQGARIMTKRTKERPVQTIAKLGFVIAAPSAMIAMNNYGDEKKREVMANIPDYEKEGNIIIVGDDATYNAKTNKWEGVTKIPVPPQHMGVHMSIQDAIKSAFTGEAMNHVKNVGRVVEDYTTINPLQPGETIARHIPQALKLVAEPMTNTNMYTGNKIVPDSQKNLPAPDQYNEYTSGTAKVLGKTLNASPRMIDNSIRTGLGGAGQNVVNMTDSALAAMGLIKKEEVQGKSIADSVKGRFSGANAISPSDRAEKKLEEFKKQVTSTDAYKNASQYDKGRMLNRLESDVKAVEWDKAPAKDGQEKDKLTSKQQSLATDGFNVDTYTDLSKKSSGTAVSDKLAKNYKDTLKEFDALDTTAREKKLYKENDAEFRYEAAKYENKKASGTLTQAETIRAEDKLAKLEAGSKFSKETRDLYSLSKKQLTALIDNGKINEKQAADILAYGDALKGIDGYNKFKDKNGNVAIRPKGRGGSRGGRKSSGRKATGKGKSGTGSKKQLPSDDRTSTIALVSGLSKKAANTKVAKRQLPKNGGISAPGIKAYKKVAKTKVSMTRKA